MKTLLNLFLFCGLFLRSSHGIKSYIGKPTPIEVRNFQQRLSIVLTPDKYGFSVFCSFKECVLFLEEFIRRDAKGQAYHMVLDEVRFPAPLIKKQSMVEGPGCNYKGNTDMRRDIFAIYSLNFCEKNPKYFSDILIAFNLDIEKRRIVKIDHTKIWCWNPWFENDGS